MKKTFSPFKSREKKLKEKLASIGLEAIFISHPANVTYLSGFRGQDSYVFLSGRKKYFLTDFRYVLQAKQELAADFQVVETAGWLSLSKKIYQIAASEKLKKIGFEAEYLSFLEFEKLKDIASSIRLEPTFNLVEELRTIKDEQEILLIRKAVEIATHTFRHLFSLLKEGVYENDLASEAEYFMRKKGAEAAAFATIIASGKHAALPHARVRRKRISLNTPVIIDLGACYQGYSCDLTRTVFLGKMSAKFSKIYQAVLQAQESALAAIKPGVAAREVDRIARESLRSFHLDKFFGHGLGHGIGLEVHEPPSLSPRAEHTLRPKMVVTLEPAVYLPGWGGVRLEDNVLITEEGCDCLSDDLDK